ncbi:hypothetical protein Tco_0404337 [Tanacetum coccineum]
MFLNMDQLEKQLNNGNFQEIGSMAAFKTDADNIDTSKALDASLVDTKSYGTESVKQHTSSRSGNDTHADDADIKPIYDEEPMAEVQLIADHKLKQHTTSLIAQNTEFEAQLQEKGFAIAALKNELRKLTANIMNTKFAKSSILRKPVLQPHRNQSVVRQPTAFKSKRPRISKPRFSSQVDVNNDLLKPVTTHYLPKGKEFACAKTFHMFAHAHLRSNVNSALLKVSSNKTTNGYKPVEQISVAKKPERQIPKGHRFSIKKTYVVHEKTMTPRSCLRWKPTGKIFKTVGLRWIPTGKIFKFSTTKVDKEPPHGTPFKLKKERIKTWTKDNVISGRLQLHGIASLKEKSARPSS